MPSTNRQGNYWNSTKSLSKSNKNDNNWVIDINSKYRNWHNRTKRSRILELIKWWGWGCGWILLSRTCFVSFKHGGHDFTIWELNLLRTWRSSTFRKLYCGFAPFLSLFLKFLFSLYLLAFANQGFWLILWINRQK